MTNAATTIRQNASRPIGQMQLLSGPRLDWIMTALSTWMIGGIHLDAWAHHQFDVETFFTPWHAVLYSGFLALTAVLVTIFVLNIRKGANWLKAMPAGYELSLLGVAIFMAGGVGDMLWHINFGIEVDIEALLSPTHLMLALGGALIVTGPIRAAWLRPGFNRSWGASLPVLLSAALLLAILTFFTAYVSLLSEGRFLFQGSRPSGTDLVFLSQAAGLASILIGAGLTAGVILLTIYRWSLPFGSLTVILVASTLLTVSVHGEWELAPSAILAGLTADVLLLWQRPSLNRPFAFRLFAFAVPAIFFAMLLTTLALTGGLWWTIHLWTGAIVLAGLVGWLLTYAFLPPAIPTTQE